MGTWGPGLYQNDVSEDVKSYFCDQLRRGKNAEQITQELMDSYREALTDSEDAPNFWFALADVQWDMGRLLSAVKEQAMVCLTDGSGFLPWEQSSKKNLAKRRIVLEKLYQKLISPQPQEKKVFQYRLYQCPWKTGDVFALPLESVHAQKLGLRGSYLLLEKAGEREYHPGHQIPVVYVKVLKDQSFPNGHEQYNKLKYIKISSQWIDTSYLRIPNHSDSTNMIRSIDEDGYLTTYRISLITTSARSVPRNLLYLGNYAGAEPPKQEYIPPWDVNIPSYHWKNVEEKVLWCYVNLN